MRCVLLFQLSLYITILSKQMKFKINYKNFLFFGKTEQIWQIEKFKTMSEFFKFVEGTLH